MEPSRRIRFVGAVTVFALLLIRFSFAQTQFATVTGRVTDNTGAAVSDATVTLTSVSTQTSQSTRTGSEGNYVFATVTPGDYNLRVEKDGFSKARKSVTLVVAQRLTADFSLKVGGGETTVNVEAGAELVNTTSGDVGHTVTAQDLANLPVLTKNPYALIGLAAGAVDSASGTGDARGQGFAVNGQRSSSLNYLLDGSDNNETFVTGPGATIPNDAVQEFKVQSNNMTAEFGRNAVVTNVVSKSGSNKLHGSASEFYRGAALTANTVSNKENGIDKPNFVRNDFTFALGGPIVKDKTFFFGALEGVRVRSSGVNLFWVPTTQFLAAARPNMVQYVQAGGATPALDPKPCITSADLGGLNDGNTNLPLAGTTPLFCETHTNAPVDAGGGLGGDTWNAIGKLDHHFTQNTQFSFRYAFTNVENPAGAGSDTPYAAFRTGLSFRSSNYTATLTHTFSRTLVNESRLSFNRTDPEAPLGKGDVNVPCLQYGNLFNTPDGKPIVFPGYLPAACGALALPSGGPQNTISAGSGFTKALGKHTLKFGGSFSHLRDNHTFGAFENGNGVITNAQNLLNGIVDTRFSVAFDPRGKVPGQLYDPAVDGPLGPPSFTRHYRYNEVAFYGEDSIRLTNRLTVTLGLRWEYFGVLHSPNGEKQLDANFFLDAVGTPKSQDPNKTIFEQIRDGRFSRTNNLFNADWNNFAPRVGFAWDVLGDGSTSIRGGYGIFYDKNFGNALFNVIQNPPNYNVANVQGTSAPVDVNQYVLLQNLLGPGAVAIGGSARVLDKDLVTSYSQQWNVGVEHDFFHKGIFGSVTYVGTKGDKLYSLNNLNQRGSCILAPAGSLPSCNPAGSGRLNQTGVTGLNRRGNEGYSRYHGVSFEAKTRSFHGLTLDTSYTYSQSHDNSSSFFGDSAYDAAGGFGFRDPFNPSLDYSVSTNDIRNKFVVSYNWEIPFAKSLGGAARQVLHGWSFSGVYSAQSGGAFSVYDSANGDSQCAISFTNYCYPILSGSVPKMESTPTGAPNTVTLYTLNGVFTSQANSCLGAGPVGSAANLACTSTLYLTQANTLSPRNAFRLPGLWNFDAALAKKVSLGERVGLDLRLEVFNLFNHSNLYANVGANDIANGNVTANHGVRPGINAQGVVADRRALQLGVKVTF